MVLQVTRLRIDAGCARDDVGERPGTIFQARGDGAATWFVRRRGMEPFRMLTGDSLSTASHASPRLAAPQTPGVLASLTAL